MSKKSNNSLLDNIIKILIILLLLGALLIVAIFATNNLKEKKEKIPDQSTQINKSENQKKVYSQDEMQEIVQMMMDQMQELNKGIDKESTKLTIDATDDSELAATLQNRDIEDKDLIEQNDSTKEKHQAKSNTDGIDRYNKVVINNSSYSDKNLDDLTQKIGDIVDDISSKKKSDTTYTKDISKEVATRVDEMRVIIVKRGDTLSKIALRAYGRVSGYHKLVEANRDLIKNPNHIYVGQRLRVPIL